MSKKIDLPDDREKLLQLEKNILALAKRKKEAKIDDYHPYEKQQAFHDGGLTLRERLLMAGNQNGKTYCGGAEISYHLTGLYPDWWLGRRWERPTRGWVAGVTGESTRDNPQRILLGTQAEGLGTGLIPAACLDRDRMTLARGVSDLYDTVLVKHYRSRADFIKGKSDGWSEMKFKSYERGRQKWQGDTLDWLWFDEEPPMDIYSEGLTRTAATGGMVFVTFTPLEGATEVVYRFTEEKSEDRDVFNMTIDDALHIPAEERKKVVDGYLPHEREARAKGIPMLGSGKVFQATEESITVEPFTIPIQWYLIWGTDFGLDHPFAAALLAWDKDTDTIYLVHCFKMSDAMTIQHAAAMKPALGNRGWKIPAAWPQDGWQRKEFEDDVVPLAKIYKKHGVKMLAHHSTFADGSNSTELGLLEMDERMKTNRFKVFRTCAPFFEEMRMYHRKEGKLVKIKDDIISATRVAVMDKRHSKAVLYYDKQATSGANVPVAKDVDPEDLW